MTQCRLTFCLAWCPQCCSRSPGIWPIMLGHTPKAGTGVCLQVPWAACGETPWIKPVWIFFSFYTLLKTRLLRKITCFSFSFFFSLLILLSGYGRVVQMKSFKRILVTASHVSHWDSNQHRWWMGCRRQQLNLMHQMLAPLFIIFIVCFLLPGFKIHKGRNLCLFLLLNTLSVPNISNNIWLVMAVQ